MKYTRGEETWRRIYKKETAIGKFQKNINNNIYKLIMLTKPFLPDTLEIVKACFAEVGGIFNVLYAKL